MTIACLHTTEFILGVLTGTGAFLMLFGFADRLIRYGRRRR